MKKIIKILFLLIVILPLLGAVGLTGGKSSGCKNKENKNTRVEKGDVNVVRRGSQYTVYGEIKNKKSKWLSDIQVKISLFDETNKEVGTQTADVFGKEPRRLPNSGNIIKENVLRKGKKGVFKAEFGNVPQNTTSAVTKIFSKKNKTLLLMAKGNLKIKPGNLKVNNRKIKGTITNRGTIPVWDVKVYAVVKNNDDKIISFESVNAGYTEDIDGVNRSNVLNSNGQDNFTINTKIDEKIIDVGSILLWATWEEQIPSAPSVPENLVITTTTEGKPFLMWNDVSNDENGFYIYRKKGNKNLSKIATLTTDDKEGTTGKESYADEEAKSGNTYYYAVSSYKKGRPFSEQKILESGYSNQVKFVSQ